MPYKEKILAIDTLEILSASSHWILVRQQWLIHNMHSILTGKNPPPLKNLYQFNHLVQQDLRMPKILAHRFTLIKSLLEAVWGSTIKASKSIADLGSDEKISNYQQLVNNFLHSTSEVNQLLWHEFTMRDSLTGAWTRMTLNTSLVEEFHRTKRYNIPCSIALLDQNSFKCINDRWGHQMGDVVLAKTAEIIHTCLRTNDRLFRYGGDEWLILMPSTTKIRAQECMERIQNVFSGYEFQSCTDETFFSSFEFGVAESNHYESVEDWVSSADKQLYQRKQ